MEGIRFHNRSERINQILCRDSLSGSFGKGFSKRNLELMRQFYLTYRIAKSPISQSLKCGNVEFVQDRIWGSHNRRFVRLTFIDSLEKLHLKGQHYNREEVIKKLSCCPHPVIAVSEETAPIGPDTVQYTNGTTFSLTVRGK